MCWGAGWSSRHTPFPSNHSGTAEVSIRRRPVFGVTSRSTPPNGRPHPASAFESRVNQVEIGSSVPMGRRSLRASCYPKMYGLKHWMGGVFLTLPSSDIPSPRGLTQLAVRMGRTGWKKKGFSASNFCHCARCGWISSKMVGFIPGLEVFFVKSPWLPR
ncbi:hypothetical protein TNIN_125551 [Trichonephila inaurata madagascariensis]|uniref:Uncharacterized protein n=1 Tax=Trichonephila inaurata madagascariensis TaxID=2747483 RepID=A0A8X6XWW7_9ARAC|nr:hypothetical protein TNIN_125551 [Trichonephila inaurata madagascariensis]